MSDKVPETVPSRPSKLTIVILIGVVIAFFALVLTAQDQEAAQKAAQSPVSATQSHQ